MFVYLGRARAGSGGERASQNLRRKRLGGGYPPINSQSVSQEPLYVWLSPCPSYSLRALIPLIEGDPLATQSLEDLRSESLGEEIDRGRSSGRGTRVWSAVREEQAREQTLGNYSQFS